MEPSVVVLTRFSPVGLGREEDFDLVSGLRLLEEGSDGEPRPSYSPVTGRHEGRGCLTFQG